MADKWQADVLKELRAMRQELHAVHALLALQMGDEGVEVVSVCADPLCASTNVEDTSTAGEGVRLTCLTCGKSFKPEVVSNG